MRNSPSTAGFPGVERPNIGFFGTKPNDELRSECDAETEDATRYASPMVLRGLLYQLTGNTEVMAMPSGPSAKFAVGKEMANDADAELVAREKR